jgi:hypothetical protein
LRYSRYGRRKRFFWRYAALGRRTARAATWARPDRGDLPGARTPPPTILQLLPADDWRISCSAIRRTG